jgi:hypothetical protein
MKAPIAVVSSLTERKAPRRMAWQVMIQRTHAILYRDRLGLAT